MPGSVSIDGVTAGLKVPVSGDGDLIDVALSLDTAIFASGDVLADTQVVTNALGKIDGTGVLMSLLLIDEDDLGMGLTLLFFQANVSIGSENSAPTINDTNMRNYLGKVNISPTDYDDWGGVKTVTKPNVGILLKAAAGTRDIYVAAVNGTGTPTYTVNGLRLRLGVLWN